MRVNHPSFWILGLAIVAAGFGCEGPKAQPLPYDCAHLPEAPLEINPVAGAFGSKDLAFDRFGALAGFDGTALVRVDRAGDRRVLSSADFGGEGPEGMEYLPDGRLISASPNFGVFSVSPEGDLVPLAPDLRETFGVLLGPDGMLYTGDNHCLYRIAPDTGAQEILVCSEDHPEPGFFTPRIVHFNLDFSEMVVGTHENRLFRIPIDANLDPVGDPVFWLDVAGSTSGVDGLVVDVCGNYYVPTYPDELYRITPDGVAHLYHKWSGVETLGHGLRWGTGRDGWRDDALYLPQPYGGYTVVEVVTGVPGRKMTPPPDNPGDAHALTCGSSPGRRGSPGSLWILPAGALWGLWGRTRLRSRSGGGK